MSATFKREDGNVSFFIFLNSLFIPTSNIFLFYNRMLVREATWTKNDENENLSSWPWEIKTVTFFSIEHYLPEKNLQSSYTSDSTFLWLKNCQRCHNWGLVFMDLSQFSVFCKQESGICAQFFITFSRIIHVSIAPGNKNIWFGKTGYVLITNYILKICQKTFTLIVLTFRWILKFFNVREYIRDLLRKETGHHLPYFLLWLLIISDHTFKLQDKILP